MAGRIGPDQFDQHDERRLGRTAPDTFEYFIVGSQVVLASSQPYHDAVGFPFSLAIWLPGQSRVSPYLRWEATLTNTSAVEIQINAARFERDLNDEQVYEAMEIFVKMCVRRGARDALFRLPLPENSTKLRNAACRLGFTSADSLLFSQNIAATILNPRGRFDDMEGVYQHPLDIPWNFVPIDMDAYLPLLVQEGRGSVLDLGMGFGRNSVLLERYGFDVHGVDVAPSAVRRCRQLVRHPEQFVVADATLLPFEAAKFDFAVDVGCLHCLPAEKRRGAVAEIRRVLKPGGVLYSRMFRPRAQEWVAVQPFIVSTFGLTPDDALELFTGLLSPVIWREHVDINYIIARKEN